MKSFKRILSLILLFIGVFIIGSFNNLNAAISTTAGKATYIEDQMLDRKNLGFGVSYYRSVGRSSSTVRSGEFNQTVYYLNTASNDAIRVISWAKFSNNKWVKATVQDFIYDFEAKNPGWTVIAGVNGDFFDINGNNNLPYQTSSGTVDSGNFYKTSGGYTLSIPNNGSSDSLIWGKNPTETSYFVLDVFDENDEIINTFKIEKANVLPGANESSVYFGQYNSSHVYQELKMEINNENKCFLVENGDLVLPNSSSNFYGKGTISALNSTTLKVGQFCIVSNNTTINEALKVGSKVRVQKEWTGEFANTMYATGCGTAMLLDGEVPSDVNSADSRMASANPRTAIGRKADGSIILVVNDGRVNDSVSKGTYGDELAAIMKHAGCVEAYNLDGGGSSTMVIREDGVLKTVNVPSDGSARRDSNALLVVTRKPDVELKVSDVSTKTMTIDVTLNDTKGHTFDKLYASLNTTEVEVIDGKAIFNDLRTNTSYKCSVYYKIGNRKIEISDVYNFSTLKEPHTFLRLEVTNDGVSTTFAAIYKDRSEETNLASATLVVNGKEYTLVNGKVTINNNDFGDIKSLILKYNCETFYETKNIVIYNPDSNALEFLHNLIQKQKDLVSGLFN